MNMQKMMKELQKMQSKMSKVQQEIESANYEGEAGGGLVKVTLNGKSGLERIQLSKEAVDPDDVEALEDLIMAAFNAAKQKVDAEAQEKMGSLTQGLSLPGM